MKQVWTSFRLAFSMYSVFPARQIEKNRENMKYILIFVPLIGAIIGVLIKQWQVISPYLIDKDLLGAVVCVMLPIFLSSGAFLDGFFRTVDALCSHQPREGKLEILKDSHSGYFAIIICVCYFFIIVGLWSEMPLDSWPVLAYGFMLSRALYGLSIVCFPHTQESKCSMYVGDGISKAVVVAFLIAYVAFSVAGMMLCDITVAIPCLLGALIAFAYYCYVAFHHFGGITEDIACFFVQVCEIMMPLVVLLTNIITRLDIAGEL
ncbi:MAG: adenosylcobinamide-GDP ribazoletransferase [Eubacteriales bacterium]|nr:adenosylcobinamide-GDP ribazoletransferase [Eubacteriales bacterium]